MTQIEGKGAPSIGHCLNWGWGVLMLVLGWFWANYFMATRPKQAYVFTAGKA